MFLRTLTVLTVLAALSSAVDDPESPDPAALIPGPADALFFQYRTGIRDLLNGRCVFSPTCSRYGEASIRLHGPLLGTFMAAERWTRCRSDARGADYYLMDPNGNGLMDPLSIDEGNVLWDQLLLPF